MKEEEKLSIEDFFKEESSSDALLAQGFLNARRMIIYAVRRFGLTKRDISNNSELKKWAVNDGYEVNGWSLFKDVQNVCFSAWKSNYSFQTMKWSLNQVVKENYLDYRCKKIQGVECFTFILNKEKCIQNGWLKEEFFDKGIKGKGIV